MENGASGRRAFLSRATAAGALAMSPGGLERGTGKADRAEAKQSLFDVTAFGAKGDGATIDTPAVNNAIEAAAAAGGGIVEFPAGTYACYSIHLKSHVTLRLAPGATILAADAPEGGSGKYDESESNKPWEDYQDFGHNHWHNSLMWGEDLENVSIVGPGLIWGKGLSRGTREGPRAETQGVGNKAISLKNCRNVLLRDFSILHGGHFGILATGVDNLTVDNLKIDTNRDGMDIDCCRNVRVSNCTVNSPWDDGICLKSSYGLGKARATEMVTITNCLVTGNYQEGTVLDATYKHFGPDSKVKMPTGRIKFGTESNGGFKNITITNCVFDGCRGLALESVDGALLEDVTISNITMRDIFGAPIFVRLGARMRGPAGVPVGAIRRVTISNVVCSNAISPISSIISGIPGHEIEDLKLRDIVIQHQGGGTKEQAALKLEEKENAYPEPTMFGPTPSHGFFVRHVKNLEMSGVRIMTQAEDARPAFVLEDVRKAELFQIKTPENQASPALVLKDVKDFRIARSEPVADTQLKEAKEKEL